MIEKKTKIIQIHSLCYEIYERIVFPVCIHKLCERVNLVAFRLTLVECIACMLSSSNSIFFNLIIRTNEPKKKSWFYYEIPCWYFYHCKFHTSYIHKYVTENWRYKSNCIFSFGEFQWLIFTSSSYLANKPLFVPCMTLGKFMNEMFARGLCGVYYDDL